MTGYVGQWAFVDLSKETSEIRILPENELALFIGGSGIGTKLLYDLAGPAVQPLSPENPLIFATGPLTGTIVPTSGRHHIIAKSPLTGIFGEADVGGAWGTKLKQAGFDGVVVLGKAARPVYILAENGVVRILEAGGAWGLDTFATTEYMREKHGGKVETACIGPAGEKQVWLANIVHDGIHARAGGRAGLGAVMGSKNLKAVVVTGDGTVPVADPAALRESIGSIAKSIKEGTVGIQNFGTAVGVIGCEKIGDLPIKNWQLGTWEKAENISGQRMTDTILKGRFYCKSCIIGCGRDIEVTSGAYAGVKGGGPEYETLGMLGSNCLVDNLEAVAYANELCNRYGIDSISTGGVIAFGMEAYEKGLLPESVLAGARPVWGDEKAMISLVKLIGEQEGLGAFLGHGVRYCAEKLGGEANQFALHVKGLELPAHDPRAYNSLAIGYATSNRGACHLQGASYFTEKTAIVPEIGITKPLDRFRRDNLARTQADLQNVMCLFDSLKLCKFLLYGGVTLTHLGEWLTMVTGVEYSVANLLKAGERIFNLKRQFNVKAGISRKDDTIPRRILTEARPDGGAAGNLPPLAEVLEEYYSYRGWDQSGRPQPGKLAELGLSDYR